MFEQVSILKQHMTQEEMKNQWSVIDTSIKNMRKLCKVLDKKEKNIYIDLYLFLLNSTQCKSWEALKVGGCSWNGNDKWGEYDMNS